MFRSDYSNLGDKFGATFTKRPFVIVVKKLSDLLLKAGYRLNRKGITYTT